MLGAGNIVDGEAMLIQDFLGLSRLTKVIKANVDAAVVEGDRVGEASILFDC